MLVECLLAATPVVVAVGILVYAAIRDSSESVRRPVAAKHSPPIVNAPDNRPAIHASHRRKTRNLRQMPVQRSARSAPTRTSTEPP